MIYPIRLKPLTKMTCNTVAESLISMEQDLSCVFSNRHIF